MRGLTPFTIVNNSIWKCQNKNSIFAVLVKSFVMAQRLIQFRLQVWYLNGEEDSFYFRSTRLKVHGKVQDLLINFKDDISHYVLYQI